MVFGSTVGVDVAVDVDDVDDDAVIDVAVE